ncbi:uncharacterized protein F5147DRAFT_588031 [Suillus discolor]|uniref:Uncharacterized protein n=1 Tax=Suillus discolor TaxID=1912936 RepID=A0A9P7JLJ8_9AGAM|nr:uncharacterized protein F5147DRAFT_588031 [Suillus discolor]KAG2087608.1 hypothetical protein F5147DRAFT_588031 [Suillus discolor]
MVVGGMTQFLTKAQGMPKSIENAITKIIRNFIWDGKTTSPISMGQLEHPIAEGGLGLLNVKVRNEAIDITWLQAYMDIVTTVHITARRPTWAFVADTIINTLKPEGITNNTDLRTFLSSWNPPAKGKRANKLPYMITNMLKITRKHHVSFAPLKISENLKDQLPAWLHMGAPPRTYHKTKNNCL